MSAKNFLGLGDGGELAGEGVVEAQVVADFVREQPEVLVPADGGWAEAQGDDVGGVGGGEAVARGLEACRRSGRRWSACPCWRRRCRASTAGWWIAGRRARLGRGHH